MLTRIFGKTGWRVGEIGLGCWQFGGAITLDGKPDGWTGVTDAESIATVQRAVDLGVDFFDTSDQYGWGRSEEILGTALKSMRERVRIASKVGFAHDDANRRTFVESKPAIVAACEASLRRLQTNYLDLYQCHLARTERWAEFLDAFETLQKQGKIRYFGVSTNDIETVRRFDERHNLAAVQCSYNLLDTRAEKEIFPYCRARGIAVIVRSPLACGKLGGQLSKDFRFDAEEIRSNWVTPEARATYDRDMETVERLQVLARRASFSLPQLALKFALSQVAVSVAIVGTKHRGQLEASAATTMLPSLSRDELIAIRGTLAG